MNLVTYIKRKLFGQKPEKIKLIPFTYTLRQRLDKSNITKNDDGSNTISLSDPDPSLQKKKLNDENIKEPQFISWLIKEGHLGMLWNELFSKPNEKIRYTTELREPFTNPKYKPGDIDIFAFQNENFAIGIECKIIKFDYDKFINNPSDIKRSFNKLNKVNNAWIQLDGYKKLGFHKTYLLFIIADDQSGNKAEGQLSRRMDTNILKKILDLRDHDDSGIIFVKVSQVTPFKFNIQNMVSIDVFREAIPRIQSQDLTDNIIANKNLFDS